MDRVSLRDGRQGEVASLIQRGVMRHLRQLGFACVAEMTLASGRRADLVGIGPDARVLIVEIKSGLADLRSDAKWQEYAPWCDEFYFAVNADMPLAALPAACGIILADGFGAEIMRPAALQPPLPAARRKGLLLRFAQAAALRLQDVMDPAARNPG